MVDTTFAELAKSLRRLSENIISTTDDTMKSCILSIGLQAIARTPKDTGRASINWIVAIDSDTDIELPSPVISKEQDAFLTFAEGFEDFHATRTKITNEVKHSAIMQAEANLIGRVNEFNVRTNRFIAVINNLDYIELLAYHDHATKARPLAPAGRIVEDNLEENNYFLWLSKADNFFTGV